MASAPISISAEPLFHLGPVIVSNSILTTWVVMAVIIGFVIWFYPRAKKTGKPSRIQGVVEVIVESLYGVIEGMVGKEKAHRFFPLLGAFFIFILLANWSGLVPGAGSIGIHGLVEGKMQFIPLFRGPTADVNTTLALALISMAMVQVYGFKYLGFKYLKKFFDFSSPINFFVGLLELISDISKVISFTFRLFGNIVAGEILLLVMGMIVPLLGPTPFIGLELFVGFIQALVFMMLTTVFINMATLGHGDEHAA